MLFCLWFLISDFLRFLFLKDTYSPWRAIDQYLRMRRAGVASPEPRVTTGVLQAKAGLVSLGHFVSSNGIQQVVVTEGVHAVVVSVGAEWKQADLECL